MGWIDDIIAPGFCFRTFNTIMKHYRLGLEYQPLLDEFQQAYYDHTYGNQVLPSLITTNALIVSGSLFLRTQKVLLFNPEQFSSLDAPSRVGIEPLCDHKRSWKDLECKQGSENHIEFVSQSGIKHCTYCATGYRIDMQDCGEQGVAVSITKWLDLGEGRTVLVSRVFLLISFIWTLRLII